MIPAFGVKGWTHGTYKGSAGRSERRWRKWEMVGLAGLGGRRSIREAVLLHVHFDVWSLLLMVSESYYRILC